MGTPALPCSHNSESEAIRCDLSRYLVSLAEKRSLRCVGTQVSSQCIRLVSFDNVPAQGHLLLLLKGQDVMLKVISCKSDQENARVFHISAKPVNSNVDLCSLLESEGLLAQKAGMTLTIGDSEISVASILSALAKTPLASSGHLFQPFGDADQNAYALHLGGLSLIVLLPRSSSLELIQSMSERELSAVLTVLIRRRSVQGDSRWIKAWPAADH